MVLTPQEVQLFRHNGFVKLPTRLNDDLVEALKATALQDIREEVEPVARNKDGTGESHIRSVGTWRPLSRDNRV